MSDYEIILGFMCLMGILPLAYVLILAVSDEIKERRGGK